MVDKLPAKQLGQLRPSNTTAVSIYAIADHYRTEIRTIIVCNTSGSAAKFRLFHDENGTTYDETTALYWDFSIATGDMLVITDEIWIDGRNDGNIAVRTDTNSAFTFTIYGAEEKIQ